MLGTIHGAVDRGTHVVVDLDLVQGDGTATRVLYTVVPGCGDAAPVHTALEAMLAAGEIQPVPPAAPTKDELKAYAAHKRWIVETGGVDVGGVPVPTDDRAKVLLLGASVSMPDGSSAPLVVGGVDYGLKTKAEFQALYAAIYQHIAACFQTHSNVISQIESGVITSIEGVESADWPT